MNDGLQKNSRYACSWKREGALIRVVLSQGLQLRLQLHMCRTLRVITVQIIRLTHLSVDNVVVDHGVVGEDCHQCPHE